MSVDFNKVDTMKYWVQKILPQSYDDSLSYQEVLYKVVANLNSLIENVNNIPQYVQDMILEYISSGEIGNVVRDILSDFMLNVKNPPNNLKPAVGDGSADDTEAIQGCIDYANANGGKCVYFPSGKYLTKSLVLKDNVSMCGFDRNSTKLVLTGGATQPLLSGTCKNNTISKMTLDGNMSIQVNDIDVVVLTGGEYTFTELEVTDGYTLMKLTVNNYVHGSCVNFGKGVIDGLVVSGSGQVEFDNLMFRELSSLSGRYVIDNSVNDAVYTDIYSVCDVPVAIKNSGNIAVFIGQLINAVDEITDTGVNTYYNFYSRGNTNSIDVINEATARSEADIALGLRVDGEATARSEADVALGLRVDGEATARSEADVALGLRVDDEATARSEADVALGVRVDSEATARSQADIALGVRVDSEATARQDGDTDIIESIRYSGFGLNVRDFGAKGDNVTDDTVAIQDAINYASTHNLQAVLFSAGKYKVSGITINTGISLIGTDPRNCQLIGNNANTAIITITNGLDDMVIKNLSINRAVDTTAGGYGIYATSEGMGFHLENLDIRNQYIGMFFTNTIAGAWISDCMVMGSKTDGLKFFSANLTFTNVYSMGNGGNGYNFYGHTGGLYMNKCEAYLNTGHNICISPENRANSSNDVVINGCIIGSSGGHGIFLDSNGQNINILGCYVEYSGQDGIHITADNDKVILSSNHVVWNKMNGLNIKANNTIVNGGVYALNSTMSYGSYSGINIFAYVTRVMISNVSACRTVEDMDATQDYGIKVNPFADEFVISACDVKNNRNGSIYLDANTGKNGKIVNCIGYNPRGKITPQPAVPASGAIMGNPYNVTCAVYISGGNVIAINVDNEQILGYTSGTIILGAGQMITIAYTEAPTWIWYGL